MGQIQSYDARMASIEQRRNTSDRVVYRVVWRQDQVKQYESFARRGEADEFRRLVEAHGNRWPRGWVKRQGFTDTAPSKLPTFTEWAVRAINARSRANERTRHDYRRDVTHHLDPAFGPLHLDEITREHVGAWLIGFSRVSSPKTVKNVHSLASSIMADAVNARLIDHNPFRGAVGTLPKVKHEEMCFLTRPEFDILHSWIPAEYQALTLTLGLTGLRWSEATALRVRDVDLSARRLSVVQAWKRTPESHYVIGEPKSARSRRTITIPPSLADVMRPLTTGRAGGEFLFVTKRGRPVRHANFRYRAWVPAVTGMQRCDQHRDAERPCGGCDGTVAKSPRIHDLRHSHASWLIAAKVPLPAIQRRLGHESITTTIDRYGHLAPELDDEITAALDHLTGTEG